MRKGMQTITVLIVAGLIFFLYMGPVINQLAEAAVRRTAQFQGERLASIINFLQAAPDTTHMPYTVMKGKCTISFNQMYVNVEMAGGNHPSDLIQTGIVVPEKEIKCSEQEQKKICVVKDGAAIRIVEGECVR